MSLLHVAAATGTGPALAHVLNNVPDHFGVQQALAGNPAVPLPVATDLAFTAGNPQWLVPRPDLDADTRRRMILALHNCGLLPVYADRIGTPGELGRAIGDADDTWFAAFLSGPLNSMVGSRRPETLMEALVGVGQDAGRIVQIVESLELTEPYDPAAGLQALEWILRAYPSVALAVRDDADHDPAVRFIAAAALPVTVDNLGLTENRIVAARDSDLLDDRPLKRLAWQPVQAVADALSSMLRAAGLPTTIRPIGGVGALAGLMPAARLPGWIAAASSWEIDRAWEAAPDRLLQVLVDHPECRRRLLQPTAAWFITRAFRLLGEDLLDCMPLRCVTKDVRGHMLPLWAERMADLPADTVAALLRLGDAAGDATFTDLLEASHAVA